MPESLVVCPHCEKSVELPVTSVTRSRECPQCGKVILLQVGTRKKDKRVKRKALLMPTVDKLDAHPDSEGPVPVSPKNAEAVRHADGAGAVATPTENATAEIGDGASEVVTEAGIVPATEAPSAVHEEGATVAPQVLVGDIRRRMMHDPEVQARVKTLKWGSSILASVILLAIVASYLDFWGYMGRLVNKPDKREEEAFTPTVMAPEVRKEEVELPKKIVLPDQPDIKPKAPVAPQGNAPWRTVEKKPESMFDLPKTEPLSEREAGAMKVAATFMNAATVEDRLKLVRDVRMMEPKIRAYYEKHPAGPIPFERIEAAEKNPLGEATYAFNVVLPSGERRRMIVGLAKSGAYVVDWASFVLYAEMDWTEFLAQKPENPVLFRVLAAQDGIYKDGFADPKGLVCLKLVDPRAPDASPVWGYASRATSLGRNLEFLFSNSLGGARPLTVGLKYQPLSAANDQVWISELVTEGWVARGK